MGILPICQLILGYEVDEDRRQIQNYVSPDYRVGNWGLPSHGVVKSDDCGQFWKEGCLNVEEHVQSKFDIDVVGKIYVKVKKKSCGRPQCPKCYESWASREAHRIEYRISNYKMKKSKPIHFIVSPPKKLWHLSLEELRKLSYFYAKKVGFVGGSCIFHPFRQCSYTKRWYVSPHFHMLGFGWIKGEIVSSIFKEFGWIFKNKGVRKSVGSTAFYQLTHSGIWYGEGKKHNVTWFGYLSYSRLKVKPELEKLDLCPLCGQELRKLVWCGGGGCPIPEKEGDYIIPKEGWEYASVFEGG